MSKTALDAAVNALLPSGKWAGSPNNTDLQTALDLMKDFVGGNVVSVDDTDSPYTVAVGDNIVLCATAAGAITLDLPAAADADGRVLVVKKTDGGVNAVTLAPDGAELIEGGASLATLDAQYDVVTVVCDGTAWYIVSSLIA